jgi:N-dimethylarginine dimethylaminohydrolase
MEPNQIKSGEMITAHSEYGQLKKVFIKRAIDAFMDQRTISSQWKGLNFLDEPDFEIARNESSKFEDIIQRNGTEINFFDQDDSLSMDSIYCRDASIATDHGMIICRMGKPARQGEPLAARKLYEEKGIKILGEIKSPGTLEGGDVAWLDTKTLAVGRTYRTNAEGIHQLREWLNPFGVAVLEVQLPHYKGPSDVFHLMSILSPVDKDLAVVYSPLIPIVFREELINRGHHFVEVPESEFDTMGCNVLALAPRKCLMVKGNPKTKEQLLAAGCEVIEYDGQEISYKGGGGPTCLTRPLLREV